MIEAMREETRAERFSHRFIEEQKTATQEIDPAYRERVKAKLSILDDALKRAGFESSEKLFREEEISYLALLEQKDSTTVNHSIGVVRILLQELPEFKDDLQIEMQKEGVLFETLLSSGLLHDIGKLGLPDSILQSTIKIAELRSLLEEGLREADPFVEQRLHDLGLLAEGVSLASIPMSERLKIECDPRECLSLEVVFGKDGSAIDEFWRYGFDPEQTSFMDVLRTHEEYSEKLVKGMDSLEDREAIAQLVGSHHNYKKLSHATLGTTSEILRITEFTAELLHLADVFHAIIQNRTYQLKASQLEALNIIREQTQKGIFKEPIAKRWIKQALMMLPKDEPTENPKLFSELEAYVHG